MQFEPKKITSSCFFSAERSCIGFKYRLAINFDSQNVFTFTSGDSHSTNVNLNLSSYVGKKM